MPAFDPVLRLLVAGGGLLVFLVVVRFLSRRGRGRRPAQDIALTGQHRVHVVEVEGRRFLIGTGPDGPPQLVCELAYAPGEDRPVDFPNLHAVANR